MELTKKQAITEHKKMWNWIADFIEQVCEVVRIDILKESYCEKRKINLIHDCFCCQYDHNKSGDYYEPCKNCPIDWGSKTKEYMCQDIEIEDDYKGLYWLCHEAKTWQEQAALARKIANLPKRTDI